jgi:tryptophanyl-tRNA synthetase
MPVVAKIAVERLYSYMEHKIFSGIQPTGLVHLGNYLGAIRNWVDLQYKHESFFCIVDYHAITIPYDPSKMQEMIFNAAVINMAAGLDPNASSIFVQSHVPEHTELAWILNSVTGLGWLERMTQFKDKSSLFGGNVTAGIFNYPVLQAADILLYKADLVPVGEDQLQHLELTRDIARRFNSTYGETFPEPAAALTGAARIMALNDPEKKMSKSIPGSYIALSDPPEAIRKLIMRAVTDVGPKPEGEMSPGVANLFRILREVGPIGLVKELTQAYDEGTLRYSDLKQAVADQVIETLKPIQEARCELLNKPNYVKDILRKGSDQARTYARETMREVKERIGLLSDYQPLP